MVSSIRSPMGMVSQLIRTSGFMDNALPLVLEVCSDQQKDQGDEMIIRKSDLTDYAQDIGIWDALVLLAGIDEQDNDFIDIEITGAKSAPTNDFVWKNKFKI